MSIGLPNVCLSSEQSVYNAAAGLNRKCNRNLQTSKAPLESEAQGTSLLTSAAANQRGCPKSIVEGKLRSDFQKRQSSCSWRVSFRARFGRRRIG